MLKVRRGVAMPTAKGLLTVVVVIFGMAVVAYVTVALSGSGQSGVASTESGTTTSSLIVSETSIAPGNQTTSATSGASSPETVVVSMPAGSGEQDEVSYLPDQVTVVIGVNNTVMWVNNDNAPHTVTAKGDSFSSGNIGPDGTYTYTFTTPGTYRYYCIYHSWMVGTVVVTSG